MTDTERKQRDEQDASRKRWVTPLEPPFEAPVMTEFED